MTRRSFFGGLAAALVLGPKALARMVQRKPKWVRVGIDTRKVGTFVAAKDGLYVLEGDQPPMRISADLSREAWYRRCLNTPT